MTRTTPIPRAMAEPMAENTEQYDWLVKIKENLEILFADREDVFIAGDLLWYPVSGSGDFRPGGPGRDGGVRPAQGAARFAYRQWEEGGIAPQVVFEVVSPSNSRDGDGRTSGASTISTAWRSTTFMTRSAIIWRSGCGHGNSRLKRVLAPERLDQPPVGHPLWC
jgi:Uma2 family endonuclease